MKKALKQPRIFQVNNEGLKEVVPGALYMKHMYGADMSVALFKFMKGKGSDAPADATCLKSIRARASATS